MSRQELIPRGVRVLVARLGLPKPVWYVGRLNGHPRGPVAKPAGTGTKGPHKQEPPA